MEARRRIPAASELKPGSYAEGGNVWAFPKKRRTQKARKLRLDEATRLLCLVRDAGRTASEDGPYIGEERGKTRTLKGAERGTRRWDSTEWRKDKRTDLKVGHYRGTE